MMSVTSQSFFAKVNWPFSLLPSDGPHNCSNRLRGKLNNSVPFIFSSCLHILRMKYTVQSIESINEKSVGIDLTYFSENPLTVNQVWTSRGVECGSNQISCASLLGGGAFIFFSRNIVRTNLSSL